MTIHPLIQKRENNFFGFWIKYRRVSFLLIIFIFWLWLLSLQSIPKESSPQIKFGIIQISTSYIWANPVDIDELITEKIEDAIDDLEGMKKYSSVSSNSFSITTIELENDTDTDAFINKVRTALANVLLPEAAEDPNITELSVESDQMFSLLLYAPSDLYDLSTLKDRAVQLKDTLSSSPGVSKVEVQWSEDYEFRLLVNQTIASEYGLTPNSIAWVIRSSKQNIPLWSYQIDDLNYDFRIQGQLADINELLELPLITSTGVRLTLGQISRIIRHEKNNTESFFWVQNLNNQRLVSLTVYKSAWMSIFTAADKAKKVVSEAMKDPIFADINYAYTQDLSEIIQEDYATLSSSALQTVILVFITMLFFVWRKPSIIATIGLPMWFMITFIVLDTLGYTLNFLTNFSLVLTLGIAIDTTIVIIEAASEKMKLGYHPKTAALFAIKDFKNSIITWTLTTIVVFIPMMTLPWVIGKFLAYIPITIFSTLLAILFLALTLNSALYYKLSKKSKTYTPNPSAEQFIPEEERLILAQEREDKSIETEKVSRRQSVLNYITDRYEYFLHSFVSKSSKRRLSIFLPLLWVIATFIFLAPSIWFTLFPSGDNGAFNINISSIPGTTKKRISELIPFIEPHLQGRPELKQYTITVRDNALDISVDLTDKKNRQKAKQRNVFEVEKELLKDLEFIVQDGYTMASVVQAGGPPQWKPVGVKLVTNTTSEFSSMITFAKSIEQYLKSIEWTKNVWISSPDTPWQFILTFDVNKLAFVGLTQAQAASEVASAINGVIAGTVKVNGEDRTIKVLYETFVDVVTPESITDLTITTSRGEKVRIGDLIEIQPDAAVAQISRENGKISVRVESELADNFRTQWTIIQNNLLSYVNTLPLPEWVSIEPVGESQENAELITATLRWFAISLALMFVILLLMFDSFTKPAIILYTIILALLWVNIGLFITWNPYSMPFMIWFIALAWIVVNDAIIFLDRVRENVSHDIDEFIAIIEAWKSRLQPILLTTITTVFGILPLALQDEFWAWLWFTIVFGLTAWSAMTLFVIPSLYYELIVIKKLTWVKILFWTIVCFPVWIILFFKALYMKIGKKSEKTTDININEITV
jgi:multidrug efflux pump subunit AcrB